MHQVFRSEAPFEDDDFAVGHEAIGQGCREGGAGQDVSPIFERFVRRQDGRRPAASVGQDLEEQIGTLFVQRQIAEFVGTEDPGCDRR